MSNTLTHTKYPCTIFHLPSTTLTTVKHAPGINSCQIASYKATKQIFNSKMLSTTNVQRRQACTPITDHSNHTRYPHKTQIYMPMPYWCNVVVHKSETAKTITISPQYTAFKEVIYHPLSRKLRQIKASKTQHNRNPSTSTQSPSLTASRHSQQHHSRCCKKPNVHLI
eukprot:gene3486-2437_t